MSTNTIVALLIGTGAMLVLIAILMNRYKVKIWKSIPVSVLLTITGTIGTYIWFFVEASRFAGRSYYGAVFLVPFMFIPVAKLMKIPYGEILYFCAPAECIMLAIMKHQCLLDGCCGGIIIGATPEGEAILFPSQIVELINAFLIMSVLMVMGILKKQTGKLYGWYLFIYGATRFVLNLFREDTSPLLMGLPAGNLWSLFAIAIGFLSIKDYTIKIIKKEQKQDLLCEKTGF